MSRTPYAHRPLAPGDYMVTASAPGFRASSVHVRIPTDGTGATHDFVLRPELQSAEKVI